ncbi:MAG: DUF4394 domain-containing protein [Verrucomicrobiota bacterium]
MKFLPFLASAALFSPSLASATLIYGLTATNSLISFDSATPGTITSVGTISQPGIVDIDFYPVNGALYGSTSNGSLYRINLTTAAAALAVTPGTAIADITDIDFNPSADRLRLFGNVDQNYRMAPDVFTNNPPGTPGAVLLDGTWTNSAVTLVGSAYTNNFDGSAATQLFSIDSVSDQLFVHTNAVGDTPGTFNQVTAVGPLGFDAGLNVGFDIDQTGIAYLSNNNLLYSLNLGTGGATSIGTVGGAGLVSIAAVAVPETSSAALMLLTGLVAAGARRRRA